MKTKGLRTLLASVAALALVGTGYAAWQFKTVVDTTKDASGLVTAAIEADSVEVSGADTLYLIFDACAESGHNHAAGNGIYWASDADGKNPVTELTLTGKVNEEDNDIVDFTGYKGKFTISASAIDSTYVSMAAVNAEEIVTVDSVNGDCVYTYTLPEVTYKSCPGSVANVSAMRAEVSDITFTVTFAVDSVVNA